jgi:predicted transcriptional regulator
MIDSHVAIKWKLRGFLEQHGITPHALAKHIDMHSANMYRLLRGDGPKTFDRETLSRVVRGLRDLTGSQDVNVSDVLEEEN